MMPRANTQWAAVLVAAGLVLSGCAVSDPTRYHALSSAQAPAAVSTAAVETPVTIGVGPVSIPGYLDRLQVVTRDGAGGVEIWPYQRWAEPLDAGVAQTLAESLAATVPSDRVAVFPWRGVMARTLDYQVVVAVVRFDGTPAGAVTLEARWRLLSRDGKELAFKHTVVTQPVAGAGIPAVVTAMNRAVDALAQDIGQEIRSQWTKRAANKE